MISQIFGICSTLSEISFSLSFPFCSGLDEVHESSRNDASSFPLDRYNPSSRSSSPQYQRPSETPSPRSPNVGSYDDCPGDWDCYEFNPAIGRTLKIEYWDRTRECKERKWDHMVSSTEGGCPCFVISISSRCFRSFSTGLHRRELFIARGVDLRFGIE